MECNHWPVCGRSTLGHTDGAMCVVYSPDGNHIVSSSRNKTIRVWDAITGQCMTGPLQGHTHQIDSVAYSPDGSHIVSGSCNHLIKVWKTKELFSIGNLYEDGGWILSSNGLCYGRIPFWSLSSFAFPVHSLVISSNGTYQHDIDYSLFGESWVSCWK